MKKILLLLLFLFPFFVSAFSVTWTGTEFNAVDCNADLTDGTSSYRERINGGSWSGFTNQASACQPLIGASLLASLVSGYYPPNVQYEMEVYGGLGGTGTNYGIAEVFYDGSWGVVPFSSIELVYPVDSSVLTDFSFFTTLQNWGSTAGVTEIRVDYAPYLTSQWSDSYMYNVSVGGSHERGIPKSQFLYPGLYSAQAFLLQGSTTVATSSLISFEIATTTDENVGDFISGNVSDVFNVIDIIIEKFPINWVVEYGTHLTALVSTTSTTTIPSMTINFGTLQMVQNIATTSPVDLEVDFFSGEVLEDVADIPAIQNM